ncbi:MAG: hypothetical protein CMJ48_14875 [Planctomycetaceae bacterium]|nr:hypothetical protein [Planctomycetaceae bacterium]
MAKKYFSSEEAAQQLGIPIDELNRLRESGELRGFADRGTFKFKAEDIEELARTRQVDSDPDVSILSGDDDALSEQPTIIRKEDSGAILGDVDTSESASDSDVRLILDDTLTSDDEGSDPEAGLLDSDSDVRLVGADSSPGGAAESSDSDVKLIGAESSIVLSEESSSVFSEDEADGSALVLDSGSDIALAADSGISLEAPADSGISLELEEDSGITLDMGDSGPIGLADDSGIALEDVGQTIPLMESHDARDADRGDTEFEVPALGSSDESDFDLGVQDEGGSGDTSVILFDDEDEDDLVETVAAGGDSDFDMSDDDFGDDDFGDDFEVTADVMDDDDLGVFDAADDDFDDGFETGHSHAEFVAPIAGSRAAAGGGDADWGVFTFLGLLTSTAVLCVTAAVVFDLIVSIRNPDDSSLSEPFVKIVSDMMG